MKLELYKNRLVATLHRGEGFYLPIVDIKDGDGNLIDFSGMTLSSKIRLADDTELAVLDVTVDAVGMITVSSDEDTGTWPVGDCIFDVLATPPAAPPIWILTSSVLRIEKSATVG